MRIVNKKKFWNKNFENLKDTLFGSDTPFADLRWLFLYRMQPPKNQLLSTLSSCFNRKSSVYVQFISFTLNLITWTTRCFGEKVVLVLDGVAILKHRRATFKILLKNVGICWLDSLIVVLFQIDDLEAKFLIELDGAHIIHLDMPKMKGVVILYRSIDKATNRNMLSKFPSASTNLRMWLSITEPMPSRRYG